MFDAVKPEATRREVFPTPSNIVIHRYCSFVRVKSTHLYTLYLFVLDIMINLLWWRTFKINPPGSFRSLSNPYYTLVLPCITNNTLVYYYSGLQSSRGRVPFFDSRNALQGGFHYGTDQKEFKKCGRSWGRGITNAWCGVVAPERATRLIMYALP